MFLGPVMLAITDHNDDNNNRKNRRISRNQVFDDIKTRAYCHSQFRNNNKQKKEEEEEETNLIDLESGFQFVDPIS